MEFILRAVTFASLSFWFPANVAAPIQNIPEPVTQVKIQEEIKIPEVLQRIANCESRNKQFDKNGNVLRGNQNRHDVGRFQINEKIWGKIASSTGYDIYTWEGNTKMALYIYKKQGLNAWAWSFLCWHKDKIT